EPGAGRLPARAGTRGDRRRSRRVHRPRAASDPRHRDLQGQGDPLQPRQLHLPARPARPGRERSLRAVQDGRRVGDRCRVQRDVERARVRRRHLVPERRDDRPIREGEGRGTPGPPDRLELHGARRRPRRPEARQRRRGKDDPRAAAAAVAAGWHAARDPGRRRRDAAHRRGIHCSGALTRGRGGSVGPMGPGGGRRGLAHDASGAPIGPPLPSLWARRSHAAKARRAAAAIAAVVIGVTACQSRRESAATDVVTANNRAVGLMGQYDFTQARDLFATLASAHPDRADLQVNLAVATLNRQQEGDAAAAQQILRRVLAADPGNIRAHYNLGLLLLNDGHPADALPHFTLAADRDPDVASAAYYAGQCLFQQGDHAGALASYERALALKPRLRSAAYGAFQALQRLGRADATRMLDRFRALEADPRSDVVEFKYTRMGPLAEAIALDQPAPPAIAPRPPGPVFESAPLRLATTAPVVWHRFSAARPPSITAADIDGDGAIDLFIAGAIEDGTASRNAVLLNRGDQGFELAATHPLAAVPDVTAALWGDYDNDGLTDVYLCRQGPNQLWRQTAKGRWADVTATAKADGGGGTTIDGALFDADHDGDLDILLIKSDAENELLNNDGNGAFRPLGSTIGLARDRQPSSGVVVADLDGDRDADLIAIRTSPPHDVLINDRTWQYHHGEAFRRFAGVPASAVVAGDLDGGAHPVLYASDGSGVTRWSRSSSGAWEPRAVGGAASLGRSPQLALADVDGDGRLDLIGTGS